MPILHSRYVWNELRLFVVYMLLLQNVETTVPVLQFIVLRLRLLLIRKFHVTRSRVSRYLLRWFIAALHMLLKSTALTCVANVYSR
jgi:hypothetical protein